MLIFQGNILEELGSPFDGTTIDVDEPFLIRYSKLGYNLTDVPKNFPCSFL